MFFLKYLQSASPIVILLIFVFSNRGNAQCVETFPFHEDFENSDGGWTTGGTASDWSWGAPAKSIINAAGSGVKCWITGTLTGNEYNENEYSWLQSPCLDFSNVKLPHLSFLVNWDTEQNYDGAALQYSVDNGNSWQSVGAFGDVADCINSNWYNTYSIRYGLQPNGWSGSGNSGSNGWVTAQHSLPLLAGKKNVRFRFVFGAGKIQNNFNGFAIDNLQIGEAPNSGTVSFDYNCKQNREVTFTPVPATCVTLQQWDFGDAAAGSNNTANGSMAVSHTFTTAGQYVVSLTGRSANGEAVSSQQTIIIPDVSAVVTTPIACNSSTGLITASVSNAEEARFSWNTSPETSTASATVKAGYYTVTAEAKNGCRNSTSVTITEPMPLHHQLATRNADCNNRNGSIVLTESGGVAPYEYAWSHATTAENSAYGLSAGTYSILITDHNNCKDLIEVALSQKLSTLSHTVTAIDPDCNMQNGEINIKESGGMAPYIYQWSPLVSNDVTATHLTEGHYSVIVSDASGCRDSLAMYLQDKQMQFSLGKDIALCNGQTLTLQPSPGFASYRWENGSEVPLRMISKEGSYSLTVFNEGGCIARDTIHVFGGCGDIHFPSAFSPDHNFKNDQFGPIGGLSLITSYRLLVYNRFGNLVFQSVNPYRCWNGADKNQRVTAGTYVYIATYQYNGKKQMQQGTITLLR